jgi:hypothetical protein
MKILTRNAPFSFLAAIILLLTISCVDSTEPDNIDDDNAITYGPVNLGTQLNVKNQQVWMPNYDTGKVSQMLLKFTGNRTIDVVVELVEYDGGGNPSYSIESVGSGKIEKGILNFKVDTMVDSNLLDSDELLLYFFNEWYLDKDDNNNITIDAADVKGNIITLVSLYKDDTNTIPAEGVIREGFSGTDNSLTGEYIYYIYVNKNCKITAKKDVVKTGLDYTYNKFEISLKTGWNTLLKSETYTTTGQSSYSMKVLNPSIRWVMQRM